LESLFDPQEARKFIAGYPGLPAGLALRIYTSRLIGGNSQLVLHGGGNTSVKTMVKSITGEEREVLFVKGSGIDLATIEPLGFAGLELAPLRKLQGLVHLPDDEMENQLQIHKISFSSPDPSVEALLHAFLPHRYIDHSHADAILVLTNQRQGKDFLREALGSPVGILPYVMPGIHLAQGALAEYKRNPDIGAIVVLHHGIFTFSEDGRDSYERMIAYVDRAEKYIEERAHRKIFLSPGGEQIPFQDFGPALARFCQVARGACAGRRSDGSLQRLYAEARTAPDLKAASFLKEARWFCQSGALTPDHVIRTKNLWAYVGEIPEDDTLLCQRVKQTVEAYQADYDQYFHRQARAKNFSGIQFDPHPRVLLAAGIGLVALGPTRKAARMAADIAEHTLRAKLLGQALGEYEPIAEEHVFDMEYWRLQQKKLGGPSFQTLQGQVAIVTGGAGAVGMGIADRLLYAGAAVVITDIHEARLQKVHSLLTQRHGPTLLEKIIFDVTDYDSVEKAFQEISCRWGGLDILVPNAGIAHVAKLEDLDPQKFEQVIAVNLTGTFNVIKAAVPIFRRQGTGGNIVVVSSKNVFDPGKAFGAYSASKAAAHQISKIAALELAELGVRVNMVNPDAIFGDEEVPSQLWELVGPERMKSRGLDPEGLREYYRQRNLLQVRVTAEHVGNAVVFFASDQTPTTGATLPIDGGIPAAFPR
jgi:rhamnose utilization protein RhaD (predicted bifunctional aldolase and dehydrogenase)/NAD(P)-dependent dehydrogenase (short-subunit alcohol dehydrogenase family)